MSNRAAWQEIRDHVRLWCKIDAPRCLIQIVHRGVVKVIDLTEFGLAYVGEQREGASEDDGEKQVVESE